MEKEGAFGRAALLRLCLLSARSADFDSRTNHHVQSNRFVFIPLIIVASLAQSMPRTFISELSFPYDWARTALGESQHPPEAASQKIWPAHAHAALSLLGVLHKYPNPHATHVVSMDTISQDYDEPSGRVRLERILGVRQGAPRWVVKVSGRGRAAYSHVRTLMLDPTLRCATPSSSTFPKTPTSAK